MFICACVCVCGCQRLTAALYVCINSFSKSRSINFNQLICYTHTFTHPHICEEEICTADWHYCFVPSIRHCCSCFNSWNCYICGVVRVVCDITVIVVATRLLSQRCCGWVSLRLCSNLKRLNTENCRD